MVFWLGLVAGLIIGWVVEWIIDWRFWRRDLNRSLDLEAHWRTQLATAQATIERLQAQQTPAQLSQPAPVAAALGVNEAPRDALEYIQGIGPLLEERLYAAGIFTFAQLSETTPEQLIAIIQPKTGQQLDLVAWIEEAKQLAQSTGQTNSSNA